MKEIPSLHSLRFCLSSARRLVDYCGSADIPDGQAGEKPFWPPMRRRDLSAMPYNRVLPGVSPRHRGTSPVKERCHCPRMISRNTQIAAPRLTALLASGDSLEAESRASLQRRKLARDLSRSETLRSSVSRPLRDGLLSRVLATFPVGAAHRVLLTLSDRTRIQSGRIRSLTGSGSLTAPFIVLT